MKLLKELIVEGKRKAMSSKKDDCNDVPYNANNNLAAKHSVNKSGAGAHVAKKGEKAPRNRQKRDWKKEASRDY